MSEYDIMERLRRLYGGFAAPSPEGEAPYTLGSNGPAIEALDPQFRGYENADAYAAANGAFEAPQRPQDPLTPAYQGVADAGAAMFAPPLVSGTEFANDPTLANATRFGVDASMAAFAPRAAAGIFAGGLGVGAAQDVGMGFTSSANADDGADPLTPPQRKRFDRLQKDMARYGSLSRAAREEYNSYLDIQKSAQTAKANADAAERTARAQAEAAANQKRMELEAQTQAEKDAVSLQEYDRGIRRAEGARDTELAKDRRFSETEMGKVWERTGGWGPAIVGGAAGMLTRAASGGGSALKNYALPMGSGALAGGISNNLPLAYNAFNTEPDNPQKRAFEAYGRELPPGHPRKEEWTNYARDLETENPVRKAASKELYDPVKLAERLVMGGLEGAAGGQAGSEIVRLPGRALDTIPAIPGRVSRAYKDGKVPPKDPKKIEGPKDRYWNSAIEKMRKSQTVQDAVKLLDNDPDLARMRGPMRRKVVMDVIQANPNASPQDVAKALRKRVTSLKKSGKFYSGAIGASLAARTAIVRGEEDE